MGALAGLATQVLSAVTTQIGSYFDVSKGMLPPRQFVVPSTAFVLACIGLAMVTLGAGVPGESKHTRVSVCTPLTGPKNWSMSK